MKSRSLSTCLWVLLVGSTYPFIASVYAQAEVTKPTELKEPIKVEADYLYYSNKTGKLEASGNVIATQGTQRLITELLEGNQKESQYYMPQSGRLQDTGLDITGHAISYNTEHQSMDMVAGEGFVHPYYMRGEQIQYEKGIGHIAKGMLTTEHAMAWKHVPDYRVEAEDIQVIPGDKLLLKEAKFFIRNWHILTLGNYKASLKKEKGFSFFPIPTFNSDNGFGFTGHYEYPTSQHGEWYINYRWYFKAGFKPSLGYRYYLPWATASFGYSKEENIQDNRSVWIEKKPEFNFSTSSYRIGTSPFKVSGNLSLGYWIQDVRKGMHKRVNAVLSHDAFPIVQSHVSIVNWIGYQKDWYSYQEIVRSMPYWGSRIDYIDDRINLWISYQEKHFDTNSPYTFDNETYKKSSDVGAMWKVDRMNSVGFQLIRDEESKQIREKKLYYHRDLHSSIMKFQYDVAIKEWRWQWTFKDF